MISIQLNIEEINAIYEIYDFLKQGIIKLENADGIQSLKTKLESNVYLLDKNLI